MNKKIYTLALLSLAGIPAMAQMDNTVVVETSVTPVVRDANKINVLPEVVESEAKKTDVTYSTSMMQTKKYVFTPVDMMSSELTGKGASKGFASLGIGAKGVLGLKAAYGFNVTENDVLGIKVSLDGYNGKADNKDFGALGTKFKSRFYSTRGGIDYTHKYADGLSELFAKFGLENQAYNYQWPVSTSKKGEPTDKQRNSIGTISVGTTDYKIDNLRVGGDLGFDFLNQQYATNMADKYSETQMHVNGRVGIDFSEEHSLNADVSFNTVSYGMKGVKGYTHLSFAPYYKYEDYDFDIKLGIFVGANGIAPDVRFDYHISEYTDLYAHVAGYEENTSLKSLLAMHPYIMIGDRFGLTDTYRMQTEFHKLDGKLGMRFRTDTGFAGDINFGYDRMKNRAELLPMSDDVRSPYLTFVDGKRFYVNIDVLYHFEDLFKLNFRNQFNTWKADNGMEDYITMMRPAMDLDWSAEYKLTKGFYVGADFKFQKFTRLKQKYADTQGTVENYKRPATFDMGLTAHYAFQKMPLSLFANIDNLFNNKFDRFYGYRSLGRTFMLGAAYTF